MRSAFSDPDAWRRELARLRTHGIAAVHVAGAPDWYARFAPHARDEGVEVHAWTFTMMVGGMEATRPDWYAVSRSGKSTATQSPYVDYYKFLCPSRAEVRDWQAERFRALASIDGLTGVHLDYIRVPDVILPIALWPTYNLVQDREYPDFDFCYCSACRRRFMAEGGADPALMDDPPSNEAWVRFRWTLITEIVERLSREVRGAGKQATAAVFPTPTIARRLVRQDWPSWPLDGVNPMLYNGFYKEPVEWIGPSVREGVAALRGRMPLYAGLYLPDLDPPQLARAATLAMENGARGVTLFEANMVTDAHWAALAPVLAGR